MRAYLAGPRSGVDDWNTPAFRSASADLRERGWDITCPTELGNGADEGMEGPMVPLPEDVYWRGLTACLVAMAEANPEVVIVLPGWELSRGARLETFVAFLRDNPIYAYPTLRPVMRFELECAWLAR